VGADQCADAQRPRSARPKAHVSAVPSRPVLRYHGGKWKLAPWILEHVPPHRIYCEPFGGAGSVLMLKPRSHGEVYNDIDGEVVNVFRVLRDPATSAELRRRIELTPFAREEFRAAYTEPKDDVDRAHKMIVRAFMGFGSASMTREHMTGFRFNSNRSGTTPATDWAHWPAAIESITDRLKGVVVENKPYAAVIADHDEPGTLFYCDPPYVHETRSSLKNKNGNRGHYYRHDMTDTDHRDLAAVLHDVEGMVIVSGYPCALYDKELYPKWARYERLHMADGARPRKEALWMNPACAAALDRGRSQTKLML
jgi:DNA adenine methylase